jgi:outer membrane protein assembly factor BamB
MENNKPEYGGERAVSPRLAFPRRTRANPLGGWVASAALLLLFTLASARAQSFGTNYSSIPLGGLRSSPAAGLDGTLYVGSSDGKLSAVRPQGALKWTFTAKGELFAAPCVGPDGVIYVGSMGGKFYAVSAAGAELWDFTAGAAIYSSAALSADGHIYFGSDDGKLYALNSDGTKQWAFTTGGPVESAPAVGADGTIYFGSFDGKVYALRSDGTLKWTFATRDAIFSSPAIGPNDVIYIGSRDNSLYAISSKGSNLWSFATQGQVNGSPAIGPDGSIYFGSDDANIYGLAADGSKKWAYLTTRWVYSTPAISQSGALFIGSLDGNVYALNTSSGALVWKFTTTGQIFSSPAINQDGAVCFGSMDGYFYQLRGGYQLATSAWPLFRANLQRTASTFVRRSMSAGYSPGQTMIVSLKTSPPSGTAVYSVQDSPPAGWTVDEISDSGLFDTNNWLVKFGPFFDGVPRTLTYQITSPLSQSGTVQFSGWASADGWANAVGGVASQVYMPAHPADYNPVQGMITINDLTAYGAAWKQGALWTVGPNPIPIDYVTRAVNLWKGGEYYQYDSNVFAAPLWWVNSDVIIPPVGDAVAIPVYPSGTDGNTNLVTMSAAYQAGKLMTVRFSVAPETNRVVYAVEDQPPAGWIATNISSPGEWDSLTKKVKWGPFFDHQPRALSYDVISPTNTTGIATFVGVSSIDGTNLVFDGQRRTADTPPIPLLTAITNSLDTGLQFTLRSAWGFNCEIQVSVDLTNWDTLTNLFPTNDLTTVIDPDVLSYTQRFYRALLP